VSGLHAARSEVLAVAVYVTLDLEFPRLGLIRVEDFDQALAGLRRSMKVSGGGRLADLTP
jgi:hypothetical protein